LTAAVTLFLAGVMMASTGQLLMKTGAVRGRNRSFLVSFLDPFLIAGYMLMLGSMVVSTIALKVLPLKMTVSLQPLGYVIVISLSVALLGERMRRHHVRGMLLILAGIVIFNMGVA
jgi:drug/metabolite transporter (DMT)-like permease